ncbi:alpha/beta fold hydrolase [Nocardia sp. NPDC052566]|uniref:alpha/beta fold hydrolase n=1 Tax=Nocardia sp. NPDC052566 TaxID=3364330 RepID=UPI0037C747D9
MWIPHSDPAKASAGVIAGLDGGPASNLESEQSFQQALGAILADHDLLLVERRGFGAAAPWRCDDIDVHRPGTISDCANRIGPRVRYFTIDQRIADLDAVRAALGVGKLSVYGTSYGAFEAQAYVTRYPDHVAAAVLDSVAAADRRGYLMGLTTYDKMRAELRLLSVTCRESHSCATLPGSENGRLTELVELLRADPDPEVSLATLDILVSRPAEPTVGRELNAAVGAYLARDPAPLRRLAATIDTQGGDPNTIYRELTAFLAYACNDFAFPYDRDAVAEVRARQLQEFRRTHPQPPFTIGEATGGDGGVDDHCLPWPTPRDAPPIAQTYPDVPVLTIGGGLDLDMSRNAVEVAAKFPRGVAIVVPFGNHSGSVYPSGPYGECLRGEVRAFFADPGRSPTSGCTAENYRALGRFPISAADLPRTPIPGLAVAFATAVDALSRRNPNTRYLADLKRQSGLRGGSVGFDDDGHRIVLDDVRYVRDVAVSGQIRLPGQDGTATAELTLSTGQRITMTWSAFRACDQVAVTGTIDGEPFTADLPTT